jgi:ABC-type branched-subunit amino acid transport system ATPase component
MLELTFTLLRRGHSIAGTSPLLRLDGLTVKVGIRRIIEGLYLEVFENDAILVSGPNGSGKSTLLNAIAGLEPAYVEAGTISIAGEDLTSLPPHERANRGISYMRQRYNVFPELTVEENLRVSLGAEGPERFQRLHPNWSVAIPLTKRAGLLSGGQKQRLAWAMATLRPFRILLADEPEAGMSETPPLPTMGSFILVSHETKSPEAPSL